MLSLYAEGKGRNAKDWWVQKRSERKGRSGYWLLLKFLATRIQFELKEEHSFNIHVLITYYAGGTKNAMLTI